MTDFAVIEEARFLPDDPPELVAAALSCRWCLYPPAVVVLAAADDGAATAACECAVCQAVTVVGLDRRQLVRLEFAPPPAVLVYGR